MRNVHTRWILATSVSLLMVFSAAGVAASAAPLAGGGPGPVGPPDVPAPGGGAPAPTQSLDASPRADSPQVTSPEVTTQALSASFSQSTVFSGLAKPMEVAFLPDGRALIIQKGGKVLIGNPSTGQMQTYMQLPSVDTTGERGLESIVLDPNFQQNGYFYLYYVRGSDPHRARVSRFTHAENTGGLSSRGVLSTERVIWQDNGAPQNCCHYGGGLDFGPDGKVYLTTGEEFVGSQAQDLSQSGGKIHRFNKDGTVPTDNPYAGDGKSSTLDTIWAYGLRNPFRAAWDKQTGRFYIGDVGGNDDSVAKEEINLGKKGANYGWPYCEGACSRSGTTNPLYSYPHSGSEAAVTGGIVYRGTQFPSQYQGAYFYGDYADDYIRYLKLDTTGAVTGSYSFATGTESVVDIAQGPSGSLFWTSISGGTVHRITAQTAGSGAPTITAASAKPTSGAAPLTVQFSGSATDPDGDALTYRWVFGDGATATGTSVSHRYASAGRYTAYLRVSDGSTTVQSDPIVISVGSGPSATIASPTNGATFKAGDTISLRGSATDAEDGTLSGSRLTWNVEFVHGTHTHPVMTDYVGATGSFQIPTTGHDYHGETRYKVTLTATDSTGLVDTETVYVEPQKVSLNLQTQPAGLQVSLDGQPRTTPLSYDTLVGFRHTVEAPSTQCVAGTQYQFQSWSDGGARSHTVTVPASATTLTARYSTAGSCTGGTAGVPTSGLVGRFEADQGVSVRSDGIVTGWSDLSGRGNTLTASGDPTLTTTPTGARAIRFDGNGDVLRRSSPVGFSTGSTARTVFLVAKYDGTGYGGVTYGTASCNRAFGAVVNPSGKLALSGWCSANDFASSATGTGAGWLVQTARYQNGNYQLYRNGASIASGTHTFNTGANSLVVGAELVPPPYTDMDVAAVVVYNRALTSTERQQVEAYLRQKYVASS